MHHSDIIGILASVYRPNVYVELGLYQGETFRKVQPYARELYGVDIKSNTHLEALKRLPNTHIHYCTTDEFHTNFTGKIDMAFIDADHCVESAKRDFESILSRLNPGGVILLHDTDPVSDHLIDPGYCGDSYKIVRMLEDNPDLNIVTLPATEAGLSIVTKKNGTRTALRQLLAKA
jgi:predicted O-methyltransferase YrrM